MVRYIYIGDQIGEDSKQFAFYDTIEDVFLDFYGQIVFNSSKEFDDIARDLYYYDRCKELIPKE
jgi:hypothetical protein